MTMVDEAKKDIMPENFWLDWAKVEHKKDNQLEKDYKHLLLKLEKWFGRELSVPKKTVENVK